MSRDCRSVNVAPSVTTNCIVSTLVLSTVGLYTSDNTPPAMVNHTFERVPVAVPRQSLRARSKCDSEPGPSVAAEAARAGADTPPSDAVTAATTARHAMPSRTGQLIKLGCGRPRDRLGAGGTGNIAHPLRYRRCLSNLS